MTHAKDRETLITATKAFMLNPNTVRLEGGVELSVDEFGDMADNLVSLLATDEAAAAQAVESYARTRRSLAST